MKRKLTLAMLLSLSAASPMALALGLGEADVRSTLNAPLRATIPLSDTGGIPPGLLNVSVADERAFAAAGLTRSPLAASVRLAVEQRQGRLVVDLTTERPVREPWVDLLLRFDWPDGQQLREVTLLLDPPDYDQMPVLVVGSTRVQPPAPSATPPAPREPAPARAVSRPASSGTAGDPAWVRSGDTLWAVAGRLRPDSGISMNQMMVALVEANPEVFPSGNINAMRAGFTLVVPGRDAIAARAGAEADRVVAAMNQAWANRGSGAPARVPLGTPEPEAETTAVASAPTAPPPQATEPAPAVDDPETDAPTEAAAAPSSEGEEGPRLTLLTDAQVAAEGGAPGAAAEAVEDAAAEGDGGAEGEGGASEAGATDGASAPQVMVDPDLLASLSGDGELTSDDRLLRLEARWLDSQQTLETVQKERDQLQDELGEMREELAALRDQLAALGAGGSGVDGPGAGGIVAPGSEAEEAPWWGAFYQGEVDRNLMLGGAGLAALLALWLVVRRRRRHEEADASRGGFGEVRVAAPGAESPVSPGAATEGAAMAGTAAAASPSRPATPVQSSMPQAEAISEADIFIAYGRYDQARDLLEAGLAREPERDDLRLKLLTVHLEQGDREAAEREAGRLRDGGNPAVADEVERLMVRHGLATASGARQEAGGRAVFTESASLPPRVFDDPSDETPRADDDAASREDETASPSAGATAGTSAAISAHGEEAATDSARYRRPDTDVDMGDASKDSADVDSLAGARELSTAEVPEPIVPPEPEPEPEPELPPLTTRESEDGREIIDYRPPSLDASPAPREETPMQPSVEFTPSGSAGEVPSSEAASPGFPPLDASAESDGEVPEEWEVEEVAFPPLDRDNDAISRGASADSLDEARRLLEAGDADRARSLLMALRQSDDPALREEAEALFTRLDS
ncbi:FimV/HubP family polar landmark protein [Halomonas campaniensis]|uniref:FimV/HubP family polar landmark protein n=1 Tax=Halomonas campaniensis TaxID=213554 RepID=UPI003562CA1F